MASKTKKATEKAPVDSIRHKDERTNIPTEELRDFVAPDEKAPKTMLYPRDPSRRGGIHADIPDVELKLAAAR